MKYFRQNPAMLIPLLVVLMILSFAGWKLVRDLEVIGLSMVPTSRLTAIEEENKELSVRVKQFEERLDLMIWLSRDCPEIRQTMDEHNVYRTTK